MASSSAISGPIPPPRSLPVTEPLPASSSLALKYRGATVEDLQLSPAVCVPTTATIDSALQVAFDHDYEQLPVLSSSNGNRKLLGYLDVKKLRADVEAGRLDRSKSVLENMVKFGGSSAGKDKNTYTLISPETGLGELEGESRTSLSLYKRSLYSMYIKAHVVQHLLAFLQSTPFALVTDASRSFVLAVATREDLSKYAQRRGLEEPTATTPRDTDMQDITLQPNTTTADQPLSRREEEEKRKDRSLAEFLSMLDGYRPLIPDEVTDHYLEKVGFECEDLRL